MKSLRIGYVPLTDAAVLIVAAERGFAEAEGLRLELVREVSWANIRDKLILGLFDAAHMLAPLALATTLGLGHLRVPLIAPFALNLNGNAVTLADGLVMEMAALSGRLPEGPTDAAKSLARVIVHRREQGREPLAFGMVFPYSTHTYLLRHWLRSGGIDPERDVQLVVVPPPYMAESLRKGLLHGFCVGSPWNSLAVDAGLGRIVALGVEIARRAPEKVLALPRARGERDPGDLFALLRALRAAARWCEDKVNVQELASLLASRHHLDLPAEIICNTLEGDLRVAADGKRRQNPDFLLLGREATNRPNPSHAKWLFAEMAHAGQVAFTSEAVIEAADIYRPDLYDSATGETPAGDDGDPVGLSEGPAFSGHDPAAYLRALTK